MKIVFLTDSHFDASTESLQREREMCGFLDSLKGNTDMLVLLGDMFDFWFTYSRVVPRGHTRLLGKLAELADSGIDIHYFVGNHDMWLFDYLQQEIGAHMHLDPVEMDLDGKRFLIGHGDGLGHLDHTYDVLRWVFRNPINQRLFSWLPSRLTMGIALAWSRHSRQSHKSDTLQYLGDENEGIVVHCRQILADHPLDYCVFGHRHTPLVRTITATNGHQAQYVNVGDWLNHRNYAVYQQGNITLHEWPI